MTSLFLHHCSLFHDEQDKEEEYYDDSYMSDLTISRIESKRRSYERSVSIRDFEVLLAFLRELGSTFICRSHEVCPLVSLL